MTQKQTNSLSTLYFGLILIIGFTYTFLLGILINKIFPGFLMQLIFLLDSIKFNNNISGLILSQMFLVNVLSGSLLIFLVTNYLNAILVTTKSYLKTEGFLKNLVLKNKQNYFIYKSSINHVFTAGLFRPNIYISSSLFRLHTPMEIKAIIHHEENHRKHHHPLKTLITGLIQLLLPSIPGKAWLFDNYLTLIEISSDLFAEKKIESKIPIVSALLKRHNQLYTSQNLALINYFNSQSERINILTGNKKFASKPPILLLTLAAFFILFSTILANNTSIFFDCKHIISCLKILVSSNNKPLLASTIVENPAKLLITTSEHCQNITP